MTHLSVPDLLTDDVTYMTHLQTAYSRGKASLYVVNVSLSFKVCIAQDPIVHHMMT